MTTVKVMLVMGSDSDWKVLKVAAEFLKSFEVDYEAVVASAHRTPKRVLELATKAKERGFHAFIVAAGAAAHLGGVIASYTTLPVIAVPINATSLNGLDALFSTVQMPSGIPVATMAIDGAKNAAIFAVEMFALHDTALAKKLENYRLQLAEEVRQKDEKLKTQLYG